jgi:hypothetical protein
MILKILYYAWIVSSIYLCYRGVVSHNSGTFIVGTLILCIGGFAFQTITQFITQKLAAAEKEINKNKTDQD